MKVVYVTVRLEVPDTTTDTAATVAKSLAFGLRFLGLLDWKVKQTL